MSNQESSSPLAIPIAPVESVFKVRRSNSQSSSSKFSILNRKNSGSLDDLKKLSRSTSSSSALSKLNKKISHSSLFAKIGKKDKDSQSSSSSKLSKTALYPNNDALYNGYTENNDYGQTVEPRLMPSNPYEFSNKQNFTKPISATLPRNYSQNYLDNLRNNNNDSLGYQDQQFNEELNGLEKLKETNKEKKLFYLKPFRSKSSDNLKASISNTGKSIFSTLTRSKSKNKKSDKSKKIEKASTTPIPSVPTLQVPIPVIASTTTLPSASSSLSTVNVSSYVSSGSSSGLSYTEEEEKRRKEKASELKRIFLLEEERKRRREQEEREKKYERRETCDSDDFKAFRSPSALKKEIDFFQDLDIGKGSRNLNLNLNFDSEDRKYSINSVPLTPTTQYLTTITSLLPNDPAREGSIKESRDTSFEFDSDDDFLNDVLAPFSKNQLKLSDDENTTGKYNLKNDNKATTIPIHHHKTKSSGSSSIKTGHTMTSKPSAIASLDSYITNNNDNNINNIYTTTNNNINNIYTNNNNNNININNNNNVYNNRVEIGSAKSSVSNVAAPVVTTITTPLSKPITFTPKSETSIPPIVTTPPVKPSSINLMDEPLPMTESPKPAKAIPGMKITHSNSNVETSTKTKNDYLNSNVNNIPHYNTVSGQLQTPVSLYSPSSTIDTSNKTLTPTMSSSQASTQSIIPPNLLRSSSSHRHHRHHHRHHHSRSSSRHSHTSADEKENIPDNSSAVGVSSTISSTVAKEKEKATVTTEKKKSKHKFSLASFRVIRKIGQGRYSKVYLANLKSKNINMALKVLPKNKEIAKIIHQIREEIKIQSHLNHRNILRLYDYFRDERKIYLVLEYAPKGSVLEFQKRFSNFSESITSKIIKQTADGLKYIHSKHIVHRDLKPENLLVDENNDIKISDFGCAVFTSNIVPGTLYGTLDYFSPEMIESKMYDERIDIWSLGVIMFELLVGKTPFDDPSVNNIYRKIKAVDYSIPSKVSMSANDLITNILIYDPEKRYSLTDILSHPWIFKYND